jgi:signal transduction histidine kinase
MAPSRPDSLRDYSGARPWRVAAASVLLFVVGFAVFGRQPWLELAARLWGVFAAVWIAMWLLRRSRMADSLGAIAVVLIGTAVFASGLSLVAARDFLPVRLGSVAWVSASALPPLLFALVLHVPSLIIRWREAQRHARQLALAEQQRAVAELSRQVTLAELQTLQAQVEPHFLYNTLAGVQYLVRHNPRLADEMLDHLNLYLRRAMPAMRASSSTVQTECELVRAYLEIMKQRLAPRLSAQVDWPQALDAQRMPPMMLATLVENAIKHGIEPKPAGGRVDVRVSQQGTQVQIEVLDDGVGLSSGGGNGSTGGTGTGLANTADRLRTLYGSQARLLVHARESGGVRAVIELPLMLAAADNPTDESPATDEETVAASPAQSAAAASAPPLRAAE